MKPNAIGVVYFEPWPDPVCETILRRRPEIRVFCAIADPANVASTAVMHKLGMRYVDDRVHRTPWRDYDVAYYEMPNTR